mgnify:CR=1 FL=1|tara:strand:+ start:2393 stop:2875 length:483 start_codon:yes stop_codon:yes gene_type:complete
MPIFNIIPNTGDKCVNPVPSGTYNRPWQRFSVTKGVASNYTNEQLDMRRKTETLRYLNNQNNITSKQNFAKVVRGNSGVLRRRQFGTQSISSVNSTTNPNVDNLTRVGNSLIINSCPLKTTGLTSESDVPGPLMTLNYDVSVPLTRYIPVRRTYIGAEGR